MKQILINIWNKFRGREWMTFCIFSFLVVTEILEKNYMAAYAFSVCLFMYISSVLEEQKDISIVSQSPVSDQIYYIVPEVVESEEPKDLH